MPSPPIVRAAAFGDLDAVTAIYAHAVLHGTGTFEIEPPDTASMARRHARIVDGGYPFLVATRSDVVVGYAYASAYRERAAYRYTVENSVYVAPQAQGTGIGRALLRDLVAAAAASGFRQMIAVIGDSANLASVRLHAGAGFTHAGVLRDAGWKAGRWLDVVLMQRALGEGGSAPPVSMPWRDRPT